MRFFLAGKESLIATGHVTLTPPVVAARSNHHAADLQARAESVIARILNLSTCQNPHAGFFLRTGCTTTKHKPVAYQSTSSTGKSQASSATRLRALSNASRVLNLNSTVTGVRPAHQKLTTTGDPNARRIR